MAESITQASIESNDKPERTERVRRSRKPLAILALTGAVGAGAISWGLSQINKHPDNWSNYQSLMTLTSPDHQQDRQNLQNATDGAVQMNEHFPEGISLEQATVMGAAVGLKPEQTQSLINTDLYPMDYDGDRPEAATSEVTKGLLAAAVGGGLAAGAVAGGVAVHIARRPENSEIIVSHQPSVE